MAQAATNPKIEELKARLKADPKSRLFYQLAEELRRAGQPVEAENVLRAGISVYPTYLAAWVSLGRACREQKKEPAAIEALTKAMQLDPGNVVAARLLGDAYLANGDKAEAIKKYKLVHALLPSDEEMEETIARLDRELNQPAIEVAAPEEELETAQEVAEPASAVEESPFDKTQPPFAQVEDSIAGKETTDRDAEPMFREHDESPFDEPVSGFTTASAEIEPVSGVGIHAAPSAEVPAAAAVREIAEPPAEESDVFSPAAETIGETETMAELYARQGLDEDARHIYEKILEREPGNSGIREKLDSLPQHHPATSAKRERIARLERWLTRVAGKEGSSV